MPQAMQPTALPLLSLRSYGENWPVKDIMVWSSALVPAAGKFFEAPAQPAMSPKAPALAKDSYP